MNTLYNRQSSDIQEVAFNQRGSHTREVEILRLQDLFRRRLPHHLSRPQRLLFHALQLIEAGESFHEVDFERHEVSGGHLLIVPAGHVQAYAPERRLEGTLLVFTPAFLNACGSDAIQLAEACRRLLLHSACVSLGSDSFSRVRHAFQALSDCTTAAPTPYADRTLEAAFSLLIYTLSDLPELAQTSTAIGQHDTLVVLFLELLEQRFSSDHQASSYAQTLHVSLRTLDRHLVAARSQTARQAISARLVLEAKRMLTQEDARIKQIAYDLGFSIPHNFTRFFRSQTGVSPASFRKSINRESPQIR